MRKQMKDYVCAFEDSATCLMRNKEGICNGLLAPAIRTREDGTQYCAFYKDKRKMTEKEIAEYEAFLLEKPKKEGE